MPGSGHAATAAAAAALAANKIAMQREKKLEALNKGRVKATSPAVRKITVVQKPNTQEQNTPRPGAVPVRIQRSAAPAAPKNVSIPLPGIEGVTMNAQMLPLAPGLILALRDALGMCEEAARNSSLPAMQEAMETIRQKAAVFQLEKLEKMASCVQRAAAANDGEAVSTLMEDMRSFVLRHITAVEECFKNYLADTAEDANG